MKGDTQNQSRRLDDFTTFACDWFWETDADHRFSFLSQNADDAVDFVRTHVLGQCRTSLTSEDLNSPKWVAHLADLAARRPIRNFDYKIKYRPGKPDIWIRMSADPQFDADGTFTGYRGKSREVTGEINALAQLKASHDALEERNRALDIARLKLEKAASQDFLTGLSNRRAFENDLRKILAGPARHVGIVHLDLDKFKWVNDTLGHPAGDTVLQTTATRIQHATKGLGRPYRVGGDEFLIITGKYMTDSLIESLGHDLVRDLSVPMQISGRDVTIGCSVGIATAQSDAVNAHLLVGRADAALYEAKDRGRNDVCMTTPALQRMFDDQRRLTADIPGALERQEFIPFFQPQINSFLNTIIGVEILARWQHPTRGLLAPAAFMRAASDVAMMDLIDKQMLKKGLAAVNRLAAKGQNIPSVSVNMSEARMTDPRLPDEIAALWDKDSFSLSLELLETIYYEEAVEHPQFCGNLSKLRAMGVKIETDDFGSGRASITGLLRIAPDRLKIDRSLVKEVVSSTEKRSLVRAILDMAQALGIACIAEGVETEEDIAAIRSLGCASVQGFAVAHPMSECALSTFLRDRKVAGIQSFPTPISGNLRISRSA